MKRIKKIIKALFAKRINSTLIEDRPASFNIDNDCDSHSFVEYYCDENGWFI